MRISTFRFAPALIYSSPFTFLTVSSKSSSLSAASNLKRKIEQIENGVLVNWWESEVFFVAKHITDFGHLSHVHIKHFLQVKVKAFLIFWFG